MRIFITKGRSSENSAVRYSWFMAFKNFRIMFSDTTLFVTLLIRWLSQKLGY